MVVFGCVDGEVEPHQLGALSHCALYIQGDQLYMAVCFWYLVKRDLFTARKLSVAYTSVPFNTVPEKHDYVYLVRLYKNVLRNLDRESEFKAFFDPDSPKIVNCKKR